MITFAELRNHQQHMENFSTTELVNAIIRYALGYPDLLEGTIDAAIDEYKTAYRQGMKGASDAFSAYVYNNKQGYKIYDATDNDVWPESYHSTVKYAMVLWHLSYGTESELNLQRHFQRANLIAIILDIYQVLHLAGVKYNRV